MHKDKMTLAEAWDILSAYGLEAETLQVVTAVAGDSMATLDAVAYAVEGCQTVEQLAEDFNIEY